MVLFDTILAHDYANQRINRGERLSTFGQIISKARKELGISQKDLAAKILKEDGEQISAQYLNDIEHDRRDPPSEFFIEQFAKVLKLKKDPLIAAAGMWPADLQQALPGADPKKVEQAFTAFRQVLNKKEKP